MSDKNTASIQSLLRYSLPLGASIVAGDPDSQVNWSVTIRALPPVFPDIYGGELALVSMEDQDITLIARSGSDGEELCRATLEFGAGHHRPFLLRSELPCTREGEGTLEIRGDPELPASIAGIGFIGHTGGAFVTQPIWTNLEQNTAGEFSPVSGREFNERFVGMRMQTSFRTFYIDFVMPWRFTETRGGRTSEGRYSFSNTGENSARLRFTYDDAVDHCTHNLTFTSGITGTASFECGPDAAQEYEWRLVEIPE